MIGGAIVCLFGGTLAFCLNHCQKKD